MVKIPRLQMNESLSCRSFGVLRINSRGIQVTDSVRHTVEKRYPGDDNAGMTGTGVDFHSTNSEALGSEPRIVQ
jgi:hypothetical protein